VLTGKILDYEWDGECEKKIGIVHDVMIGEFEGEASVLFELAPRDKSDKPNRLTSENQVCFDVSWVHFPSLFLLRCSRRNHSIRNRPGRDREKRRRRRSAPEETGKRKEEEEETGTEETKTRLTGVSCLPPSEKEESGITSTATATTFDAQTSDAVTITQACAQI
jgi:hypothetical protein